MRSIFRSEDMQLSQLILHTDSAYNCIAQLGELGIVQLRDVRLLFSVTSLDNT